MGTLVSRLYIFGSNNVKALNENRNDNGDYCDKLICKTRMAEIEKMKEETNLSSEKKKIALGSLSDNIKEMQYIVQYERLKRAEAEKQILEMMEEREELVEERIKRELAENRIVELELETKKIDKLQKQIRALKDVKEIGKELLKIRETQVSDMNDKLQSIEMVSKEYAKEVENMRTLKSLYEQRAQAKESEHQHELEREQMRVQIGMIRLVEEEKKRNIIEQTVEEITNEKKEVEEKLTEVNDKYDKVEEELRETRVLLAEKRDESCKMATQMTLVNNLLSQILCGPEFDLERLAGQLEEHHNLLTQLTEKGDVEELAGVLVDLVGGVVPVNSNDTQRTPLADNLGKVWRVLQELMSHHDVSIKTGITPQSCYKNILTPEGPKAVVSVSRTFLRLKDLILEKNGLIKEVGRLKSLNQHLETRLNENKSRFSNVTEELRTTWELVDNLKKQYQSLHTYENITKYQLSLKRQYVENIKEDIKEWKESWAKVREKNRQNERDWRVLRKEFAARKRNFNNSNGEAAYSSVESGYEDDETSEEEDKSKKTEENTIDHQECTPEEEIIDYNNPEISRQQTENNNDTATEMQEFVEEILGSNIEINEDLDNIDIQVLDEPINEIESEINIVNENTFLELNNIENETEVDNNIVVLECPQTPIEFQEMEETNFNHINDEEQSSELNAENELLEINLAANNSVIENTQTSEEFLITDAEVTEFSNDYQSEEQIIISSTVNSDDVAEDEIRTAEEVIFDDDNDLLNHMENDMTTFVSTSINIGDLESPVIAEVIINTEIVNEENGEDMISIKDDDDNNDDVMKKVSVIFEEVMRARNEKLECLESQCQSLIEKMSSSTEKCEEISKQIELLEDEHNKSNVDSKIEIDTKNNTTQNKTEINNKTEIDIKTEIDNETEIDTKAEIKELEVVPPKQKTLEEILKNREDRFKRMESMSQEIFAKMAHTSKRSDEIAEKLDELHELYGCTSSSSGNKNDKETV